MSCAWPSDLLTCRSGMPILHEILSVRLHEPHNEHVALEAPVPGPLRAGPLIVGGRITPGEVSTVMITHGARTLVTVGPVEGGFDARVDLLGLPEDLRLGVSTGTPGRTRPLGTISLRRVSEPSGDDAAQPLSVTSLGRSGSTWMMRLLLADERVVGRAECAFEAHVVPWALGIRRAVVEYGNLPPGGPTRRGGPVGPGLGERGHAGDSARHHLADDLARTLMRRAYAAEPPIRYFAEKGGRPLEVRELFSGAREIFLIRDPRDILVSVLAFNKRRGFADFGRQDVTDDLEYVTVLARRAASFHSAWKRRRDDALMVRYEDLATRTDEVLASTLDHLSLESDPDALIHAAAVDDRLGAHRTAADAISSVGRWRNELTPELANAATEHLAEIATSFGYEA